MPFRGRVLGSICAAMLGLAPGAVADQSRVLTHAQIADRDRPGTVLIESIWTADAQVGREVIDVRGLIEYVENQVRNELVANNPNAKVRAIFEELLKHPTNYLKAAGPPIALKLKAGWTGSGFIVTPDGYLLTNEHVVHESPEDLKDTLIRSWQSNDLSELFTQDFTNFKRAFANSKAVDEQAIADKMNDFVHAELQFYQAHLQLVGMKPEYSAEMGVAVPGLNVLTKRIPCDLRKEGEPTPGKDVAVMKIEQNNLPTVPVGDDTLLRVGDSIVVIGYPGAADLSFMTSNKGSKVESTLTQGELSARKEMRGGWSALQTSAEINHGNSGGPAFNDRGEAIGLATFTPAEEGVRGINFLVPMSVAKEFLDELGVKPRQSRLSELFWAALDDMDKGDYKQALDQFKEVSDLSPGFPFIQDKIAQCRNSIDQGLDRGGLMGNRNYLIGGMAVLLILLTFGWFLLRRNPARVLVTPGVPNAAPAAAPPRYEATVANPAANLPRPAQTVPAAAAPRETVRSFGAVQCVAGSEAGRRYEVTKQGLLIGRDPNRCQIVLTDDSVSKEHAWIVPLDDGTVVIDRGSTNGTFINSVESPKVSKVRLQHGDRIFIGKSSAVLTYFSA